MGQFYERLSDQLSLYVRQLAWLNAAPEAKAPAKVPKGWKAPPPVPRIKRMKADGLDIPLPENPLPYITAWLMEAGPVSANGMGSAPLDWREIAAWQDLTGADLTAWEARTLRRLSRDFHDQMHKAKEPTCPPPFTTAARNDDAVTKQFAEMFRRMAANKKKERQT